MIVCFLLVFVRLVVCLFVCLFEEKDDDDTCLPGPCPPVGWFVSLCVSFLYFEEDDDEYCLQALALLLVSLLVCDCYCYYW